MKHEKTFGVISKLKDIERELHRLKNALEMANNAIDAAVAAEREACLTLALSEIGEDEENLPYRVAAAIRARGNT